MVARLKGSPASDGQHRKLVLANVHIGEAEDWRWYWTWSRGWRWGTRTTAFARSWLSRLPDVRRDTLIHAAEPKVHQENEMPRRPLWRLFPLGCNLV